MCMKGGGEDLGITREKEGVCIDQHRLLKGMCN